MPKGVERQVVTHTLAGKCFLEVTSKLHVDASSWQIDAVNRIQW
jgi:hypothetical protein